MKNDLVPVTALWIKKSLSAFETAQRAMIAIQREDYLTMASLAFTRRRLWGILPPFFKKVPSEDEIIEFGKNQGYWMYPYFVNVEERVDRFVKIINHMIEATAHDEVVYITPHTIEILLNIEEEFDGNY